MRLTSMLKSRYAHYTPAAGNVFHADLRRARAARMALVRPNSRAPAKKFFRARRGLSGLSAAGDWLNVASNFAQGAVNIGMTVLQDKRAKAAARLQAAQAAATPAYSEPPVSPVSRGSFPVVPLLIGAAVLGGGFLLLRKGR